MYVRYKEDWEVWIYKCFWKFIFSILVSFGKIRLKYVLIFKIIIYSKINYKVIYEIYVI